LLAISLPQLRSAIFSAAALVFFLFHNVSQWK